MSKRIKLDEHNFNKHSQYGMELLEKSIQEVGAIESVTLDRDGSIVSGNARQQTFEKLGYKPKYIKLAENEYPVIETDLHGEKRVKAALLANTVAKHNIRLDDDKIQEVAVDEHGIDVQELGIDLPEGEEDDDLEPKTYIPTFKFEVECKTEAERNGLMAELMQRGFSCTDDY